MLQFTMHASLNNTVTSIFIKNIDVETLFLSSPRKDKKKAYKKEA